MKPGFALDLSPDGIGLLHRGSGSWNLVGEVSLDDPALATTLSMLRDTASELEGGGVLTKLILPDSQILYTRLPLAKGNAEQQEAALRKGLDGLTPYRVEELVFDWAADGTGAAQLAVVARETLDEAEAFAVQHNFNPVCFVAAPAPDSFPREPWFGRTRAADALLADGDALERDTRPVVRNSAPGLPDVEGKAHRTAEQGAQEPASVSTPDPGAPGPDTGEAPTADATPRTQTPVPEETVGAADAGAPPEAGTDAPRPDHGPDAGSGDPALPMSPLPPPETRPIFLSGRHGASKAMPGEIGKAGATAPRITLLAPPGEAPAIGPAVGSGAGVTAADAPPTEPEAAPPAARAGKTGTSGQDAGAGARYAKTSKTPNRRKAPEGAAQSGVKVTPGPARPAPQAIPITPPPANEAEALTVFGARGKHEGHGGFRFGLVVALVLLALLGGGAVWSAFFLSGRPSAPAPAAQQSAQAPANPAQDDRIVALPEPETPEPPVSTASPRQPDRAAADPPPDMAENPPRPGENDTVAEADTTPQDGRPTREEAAAIHARTGAWPRAPDVPKSPASSSLDAIYIAGTDPRLPDLERVALPDPGAMTNDSPPAQPMAPPPPGVAFDLDERGLVTPTPEGTLSPRGNMIYSGEPPVVPPARPDTDAGLVPAPEQIADPERTRLAAFRPRPRPEIPEIVQEDPAPDPEAEADEAALAESPLPASRPSGFAAAVEAAVEAAQPPATTRPEIPTSASVARQATIESVINLRETNLIGVYGPASERRALVRLSSGRYLKVQVGDRLDGGRVAAISENALRYVKNGRNIVIEMPEG